MMGQPLVLRQGRSFISRLFGSRGFGAFIFCFACDAFAIRSRRRWYRIHHWRRGRRHTVSRYLVCKQTWTWYRLTWHGWILAVVLKWHRCCMEIARYWLRLSRDGCSSHSGGCLLHIGLGLRANVARTVTVQKKAMRSLCYSCVSMSLTH